MESCSNFEAIAAYDLKNRIGGTTKDSEYCFIIDTDTCNVGVCHYMANGQIVMIGESPSAQPASVVQNVRTYLQENGLSENEIDTIINSGSLNDPMWNYYTRGKNDDTIVMHSATGRDVMYQTLDSAFETSKRVLQTVIEQGFKTVEQNNIDEDMLRILSVGALSSSAPVKLMVRSFFSFDPFLSVYSDERFIDTSTWPAREIIIQEGTDILDQLQTATQDVVLRIVKNDGTKEELFLMRKQQKIVARENAQFSQPIFASKADRLQLHTSSGDIERTLPEGVLHNGLGLIELCCIQPDKTPVLLIRNAVNRGMIYEVALS